ncbi:hypothetical protein Poly59_47280 [Rubripirellula reticaptiva]|uniref:Uncharacterized protein n=1 Tax=Rubripirellula reticaptiva TaxID=2528013 RepID=A0A5C6EJU1_9BACT|nr:hypothetical protein Poly59_47280 [Rubripirellula reticaptiva]
MTLSRLSDRLIEHFLGCCLPGWGGPDANDFGTKPVDSSSEVQVTQK